MESKTTRNINNDWSTIKAEAWRYFDTDQYARECWEYTKRRSMQEILPGIYLGPYSAATKSQFGVLKSHGITHIVCVRSKSEAPFVKPNFLEHFRYMVLEIEDSTREHIIKYFLPVKNFIDEALSNNGKVLIHSNTGNSRSAALVIAYIMQKGCTRWGEAYDFVLTRRMCIAPNDGFCNQLKEFEAICSVKEINFSNNETTKRGVKRPLEEEA